MNKLFIHSKSALGERYSEEMNIELPIEKSLDALSGNDKWLTETKNWLTDFHEQYSRIKGWSSKNIKDSAQSSFQIIGLAADHLHKILSEFRNNKYCLYSNSEELEKQTQRMLENLNLMQDCLCHSDSDNTNTNSDQIEEYEVIQARNFFEKFLSTLSRPSFLAGKNRVLLLTGPAGSVD